MEDGEEKKVFASFFGSPEDRDCEGKMHLLASCNTSDKFFLVARHTLTTGLQKAFRVGTLNILLTPPPIVKKVGTGSRFIFIFIETNYKK